MRPFSYVAADDLLQASEALAKPGTMALAGGTELLNWMRLGIAAPDHLVDLGRIAGLGDIALEQDALVIGGGATLNAVGEHPLIAAHAAALSEACLKAASAQIRNRATLGGNVLQKTRCAYFRDEAPLSWPCNQRAPGSGCAALHGLNHAHAILGWTQACVATHPSDPLVALACLDAEIAIAGQYGERRLPIRELHRMQEDGVPRETLRPGEIITACRVPVREGWRSAYVKVRERESYEYALVSAAAAVRTEGGRIAEARIALGSVAARPWRLAQAEAALVGALLEPAALVGPIEAALVEARPLAHNGYKVAMSRNAAVRALLRAAGAAP